MISANGGLPAHRYTPQVTPRWPWGSEPASGGTWHIMVGATFEGMFYMHGICLDMLTPMLYIFVWPKRWGAIRDKGFAHVPIVEFKALD